jgi:hypothetical protein
MTSKPASGTAGERGRKEGREEEKRWVSPPRGLINIVPIYNASLHGKMLKKVETSLQPNTLAPSVTTQKCRDGQETWTVAVVWKH